jgi:hypothetical protein
MKKRFYCIIFCYFSAAFCYSQKGDSLHGKGLAVNSNISPGKDSLSKLNFILFDSVMVVIYGQTRLRINSLDQLRKYLDHSAIKFDSTDAIITTSQMTDMRFYDPLKNFIQQYKFHAIVSNSVTLQAPGPAR